MVARLLLNIKAAITPLFRARLTCKRLLRLKHISLLHRKSGKLSVIRADFGRIKFSERVRRFFVLPSHLAFDTLSLSRFYPTFHCETKTGILNFAGSFSNSGEKGFRDLP